MNDLIHILRSKDNAIETKGFITVGEWICKSLELPWKNNQSKISSIPDGKYDWVKVGATKAIPYPHISILNVPGRLGVCIHYGNFATGKKIDIEGCVIVGTSFSDIDGNGIDDIVNSKNTFLKVMDLLPDSGKLIIETETNLT